MATIRLFLLCLIHVLTTTVYAQNYCYVSGGYDISQKQMISAQLKYCAELFGMENATIAVMENDLPRKLKANISYEENTQTNRKMFLIRLNSNLNESQILPTLSHEMIHAFQYYSGDLVRHDRYGFTWRGKFYMNIQRIDHSKRPWEIEANDQSVFLTDYFSAHKKGDLIMLTREPFGHTNP